MYIGGPPILGLALRWGLSFRIWGYRLRVWTCSFGFIGCRAGLRCCGLAYSASAFLLCFCLADLEVQAKLRSWVRDSCGLLCSGTLFLSISE